MLHIGEAAAPLANPLRQAKSAGLAVFCHGEAATDVLGEGMTVTADEDGLARVSGADEVKSYPLAPAKAYNLEHSDCGRSRALFERREAVLATYPPRAQGESAEVEQSLAAAEMRIGLGGFESARGGEDALEDFDLLQANSVVVAGYYRARSARSERVTTYARIYSP